MLLKHDNIKEIDLSLQTKKLKVIFEIDSKKEAIVQYIVKIFKKIGLKAYILTKDKFLLIRIMGMSCYSCVSKIEGSVKKIRGVDDILVNLEMKKGKILYSKTIPN